MSRGQDLFNRLVENGEKAIDELIQTFKSEELFLDFKRSSNDGSGTKLSEDDRNNLSKAISGFGNSEGGIIVWGIDCRRDPKTGADIPQGRHLITDVHRFVSWLENTVSGCTIPPHNGVRSHPIPIGTSKDGFVVTYIPKGNDSPYQVVSTQDFLIRTGSNFSKTPYSVLAGMFGKRPQPNVYHRPLVGFARIDRDHISCSVEMQLYNDSPVVAVDIFITILCFSKPGINCEIRFGTRNLTDPNIMYNLWEEHPIMTLGKSVISIPTFRMAPYGYISPLDISLRLAHPFTMDLKIEGKVGCANAPVYSFKYYKSAKDIEALYNDLMSKSKNNSLKDADRQNFIISIFDMNDNS